jgi:hypothetical integral membrane protein (TIGR02206 family)
MSQASEFHLFGEDHAAVLMLLLTSGIFIAWIGRCAKPGAKVWTGRVLGLTLTSYAISMYAQMAYRGELGWAYSLPLELCHWVLIACLAALFFHVQPAAEIAYFWGLGGTLQAVLTPDLLRGFPSWEFIQFFWAHGSILLTIVYLIAVRRFRPRQHSVLRMMLAANFYLVLVGSLDLVFGWNYGYLRQPPYRPSLLDYLGPWPWYIASLELVALLIFWVLSLPWKIRRPKSLKEK